MSLPSNPMFDAAQAQTGEIPAAGWPYEQPLDSKAQAFEPDAFVWPSEPKMPARLQTMMLPNGKWLLVLDNASEVERLDVDRERLRERTGAVDVLTFVGPVEVVEAYPEPLLEQDEALIGRLRELGKDEALMEQAKDEALMEQAREQGDGVVIPPQRVA